MDKSEYKITPIGLIPYNWEIKKIGEISKNKNSSLSINALTNNSGKYTLYGACGILKSIDFFEEEESYISIIKDGAGVGRVFLCDKFSSVLGTMAYIKPINENVSLIFLYYLYQSIDFERFITGSTIPHIYFSTYSIKKIPLPPLPEQQKIASILSTWDLAIDNCKNIIEDLKLRNKGLAQQLLTGKLRVCGFEKAKWILQPIKKISKDSSKKNPSNKELIVLSCTKYKGLVPSLEYFGRKIYSDNLTTYKIVSKGQFAYATNHIEEGSIGYQSKYDEALISPMYTVFQTDDTINDNFLFRVLKSNNYIHEYQKRMEGSIDRRGGLRWDEFSKIKVPVPELIEQNAIVDILDKASEELKQYQQKLETLQLQKKGLMQQLLTGKTRVKI